MTLENNYLCLDQNQSPKESGIGYFLATNKKYLCWRLINIPLVGEWRTGILG